MYIICFTGERLRLRCFIKSKQTISFAFFVIWKMSLDNEVVFTDTSGLILEFMKKRVGEEE